MKHEVRWHNWDNITKQSNVLFMVSKHPHLIGVLSINKRDTAI